MSLQGLQHRAARPFSGSRLRPFLDYLRGRDLAREDHWLVRQLGGPMLRLAGLALLLSFFLPVHGLTPSLCVFQNLTGHPCPSCGLTRSVTAISHLDFTSALHYNPFGFLVYPALLFCALVSLLPRMPRRRLLARTDPLQPVFMPLVFAALFALMAFGIWRIGAGMQL